MIISTLTIPAIAFVFTIFILSLIPDLLPAAYTEKGDLKDVPMVRPGERGEV
jgi:hypothetical protein